MTARRKDAPLPCTPGMLPHIPKPGPTGALRGWQSKLAALSHGRLAYTNHGRPAWNVSSNMPNGDLTGSRSRTDLRILLIVHE